MQKPIAEKGEVCPFNGKGVEKACHKCPLYVQVRGVDMNTNREVDRWACSFAFLPMLLIENSGQQRQTGAAVESLRNEVVHRRDVTVRAAQPLPPQSPAPMRQLRSE